ncbi:MAG: leader peptide processing enzyme [Spirochaetaceae bacterium]|nr:leader peptide processing enzyme [Spirochaetaceae bacterium]
MSKTSNTVIFVLLATVVNVVMIFAVFILCVFIGSHLFDLNSAESSLPIIVMAVSFVISLGGTLFLYAKLVKWATIKFDLDSKLAPMFNKKRKK